MVVVKLVSTVDFAVMIDGCTCNSTISAMLCSIQLFFVCLFLSFFPFVVVVVGLMSVPIKINQKTNQNEGAMKQQYT
jgi:hypothetical protein